MGEWAERSPRRYPTSFWAASLYGAQADPGLGPGPPAEPTLPAGGRQDPDPSAWPWARPLAHKHPASGLSPGQLSAGQAGGRRVRAGRGRRSSPTVKKPWFPAHAPERRRTATHQVPVPDTLRVHPLHSPRMLSRCHAAETLPQRERHPASDSGRRGTDRVPGGPARPPLRIGPVPQPRAGGPLSLQDPGSRGCLRPGVPSQPQEEVKFKACALHLKMHTKARSPKTHGLSK